MLRFRARRAAAGLFLGWACAPACGPVEESREADAERALPAGRARVRIEEVVFDMAGCMRRIDVLESRPDRPPAAGTLRPSSKIRVDGGIAPTLILSPPARVVVLLPEHAAGARLRLAVGADESEYVDGRAGVRFVARLGDADVLDEVLRPSADVPPPARAWRRSEVPVGAARRLVLETRLVGDGEPPAAVGFGGLEIVRETEVRRQTASVDRPSVLLVCIDTLRADRLGCYGYERDTSPTIDALAAAGTRFERAYVPSPWTWPSTASLLSGLTPPEHGLEDVTSSYLANELAMLAEAFQRAGLTTGAFSTNKLVARSRGFAQGFETFEERRWEPARDVVPAVLEWLDERADERFFLYLHLTDPHSPYEPEPDLRARFVRREVPELAPRSLLSLPARRLAGDAGPDELAYVELLSDCYDGEVASVDRALGRLFAELERRGLRESTLICVTSDHGEEFLDHGLLGHGHHLHDETLRVPLVLAGPGVPRGAVVDDRVENRFVASTLLALADVPARGLRGVQLLDRPARRAAARAPFFFATEPAVWVDAERVERVPSLIGVDVDGFRLVWAPGDDGRDDGRVRLFGPAADAGASGDLAAADPIRVHALQRMITSWIDVAAATRPEPLDGGSATVELLRSLGYLEGD